MWCVPAQVCTWEPKGWHDCCCLLRICPVLCTHIYQHTLPVLHVCVRFPFCRHSHEELRLLCAAARSRDNALNELKAVDMQVSTALPDQPERCHAGRAAQAQQIATGSVYRR